VRRGTINEEERNLINNHALVTHKMLAGLPFPKKLRHVADYAVAHHENIDGSGYPFGLKGDEDSPAIENYCHCRCFRKHLPRTGHIEKVNFIRGFKNNGVNGQR